MNDYVRKNAPRYDGTRSQFLPTKHWEDCGISNEVYHEYTMLLPVLLEGSSLLDI